MLYNDINITDYTMENAKMFSKLIDCHKNNLYLRILGDFFTDLNGTVRIDKPRFKNVFTANSQSFDH